MARSRPHVTSERRLDAALLTFDIPTLLAQIKTEDAWRRESHTAMTLVKSHGLCIILVAMHGGVRIAPHQTDGPISIQAFDGAVSVNTETQKVTLRPGQLLMLHSGVYHVVHAQQECAFLLTLSAGLSHPLAS
jgi:quercetin dioxygenase-like cupin family protein